MKLFRPVSHTVMAVQWNGTNEDEVKELIGLVLPLEQIPVGHWVVVRPGDTIALDPAAFASQYEPAATFS